MTRAILALFTLFTLLPTLALAQDYVMYETQYLTVSPGHTKQFGDAMKAHNDKYHASGPYTASVWAITNGPRSGQIFWAMGPCTFTDFDKRPSSADHESDWADNVLAHAEPGENEYWRMDEELSINPVNSAPPPLIRVRIFDIKKGQHDRFEEDQRKIKEVLKNRDTSRAVYRTAVASGTGRDFAVATTFENWAAVDAAAGGSFVKDYEEVHGPGSFASFRRDRSEFVEHFEDEFHELLPELSASPTTSNNQ